MISSQLKAKFGGNDQAGKVAERSLYNTLEQGVPFISLLWMCAACVDAAMATSIGFVYSSMRMFYGLAYSYYGGFSMCVELITQPNYTCIHVLAAAVLSFALGGPSIFELPYLGQNFLLWLPVALVGNVVCMFLVWDYPAGGFAGTLNLAYNAKEEP